MNELIRTFRPFVSALCRRYTHNAADAEDLEQEVWLTLVTRIGQIREPAAVHGWLKQIVIRTAITNTRRAARELPAETPAETPASGLDADPTLDRVLTDEASRLVRQAVARLQPSDRALLGLLTAVDRPDYSQISTEIGRPVGSIGPTRQRVLDRLRRDRGMVALV